MWVCISKKSWRCIFNFCWFCVCLRKGFLDIFLRQKLTLWRSFFICLLTTNKRNTSISPYTSKTHPYISSKSLQTILLPKILLNLALISSLVLTLLFDQPIVRTNCSRSISITMKMQTLLCFHRKTGQHVIRSKVKLLWCSQIWG